MTYRPYAAIIAEANANSSKLVLELVNGTATTIPALTPVGMDNAGNMQPVSIGDNLSSVAVLGITESSVPPSQSGNVVFSGRIENVSISAPHGSILYVSKTGTLTTNIPTVGMFGFVPGDEVIRIGGVVKNKANPSLKDIIVRIEVIGTL
jgi:hypothetical protein